MLRIRHPDLAKSHEVELRSFQTFWYNSRSNFIALTYLTSVTKNVELPTNRAQNVFSRIPGLRNTNR